MCSPAWFESEKSWYRFLFLALFYLVWVPRDAFILLLKKLGAKRS